MIISVRKKEKGELVGWGWGEEKPSTNYKALAVKNKLIEKRE